MVRTFYICVKSQNMKDELKVGDKHRKNALSLVPGGSTVKTIDSEGLSLIYDKVKVPDAYVSRIIQDPSIVRVYVDGELFWERE